MISFEAASAFVLASGREAYTPLVVPERRRHSGLSVVKGETGAGLSLSPISASTSNEHNDLRRVECLGQDHLAIGHAPHLRTAAELNVLTECF